MSSRPQGLLHPIHVGITVRGFGQEMKRGAIVPEVECSSRPPLCHIGDDPRHPVGCGAETFLCDIQGSVCQIENGYIMPPSVNQRIDEPGGSAANVDDRCTWPRSEPLDQIQRSPRLGLEPAQGIFGVLGVAPLPMITKVGLHAYERLTPIVTQYSRGTQMPSSVGKPSWKAMKSRLSSARLVSSRLLASVFVGP